jgi:hypothetical protein
MPHLLWTQKQDTGPGPREGSRMTYDAKRNCVVLFGGHSGERVGDTWE